MAKKFKRKAGMLGIVMGGLILIFCILAIVGIFINAWTASKGSALGFETNSVYTSLSDWAETLSNLNEIKNSDNSLLASMVTFGYLTAIVTVALAVCYLLKMVLNIGLFRFIVGIGGIATVVLGIILLILSFQFCENGNIDIAVVSTKMFPAAGVYLTSFGAILAGACAVVGCSRK